jgi:hypothetical protein
MDTSGPVKCAVKPKVAWQCPWSIPHLSLPAPLSHLVLKIHVSSSHSGKCLHWSLSQSVRRTQPPSGLPVDYDHTHFLWVVHDVNAVLLPLEGYCRKLSQNSHVESLCSALPRWRAWVITLEGNKTITVTIIIWCQEALVPKRPWNGWT